MSLRVVIMGVSGSGKTSLGQGLAARLSLPYADGDDLHPQANLDRMAAGIPLRDADRWPWLDRVAALLSQRAPVLVGCSALRRAYRDRLREGAGGPVLFLHLAGSRDTLQQRMSQRSGHFMPPALLDSQLATLEPLAADEDAVILDLTRPLPDLIDQAARAIIRLRDA